MSCDRRFVSASRAGSHRPRLLAGGNQPYDKIGSTVKLAGRKRPYIATPGQYARTVLVRVAMAVSVAELGKPEVLSFFVEKLVLSGFTVHFRDFVRIDIEPTRLELHKSVSPRFLGVADRLLGR